MDLFHQVKCSGLLLDHCPIIENALVLLLKNEKLNFLYDWVDVDYVCSVYQQKF